MSIQQQKPSLGFQKLDFDETISQGSSFDFERDENEERDLYKQMINEDRENRRKELLDERYQSTQSAAAKHEKFEKSSSSYQRRNFIKAQQMKREDKD